MKTINKEQLDQILEQHKLWLKNDKNGKRANLRGADLEGAMLAYTLIDDTIVSITQIGSRKGTTTYNVTKDIIWCGCFTGTLEQFERKVHKTHENNPQYLAEYEAAITFFKTYKNN